jgi:hypothetical protein
MEIVYPSGDSVKSSMDRKCYIKRRCDIDKLYHTHDIHHTYEINRIHHYYECGIRKFHRWDKIRSLGRGFAES